MKNKSNQHDGTYTSLIYISLVLLVIMGITMGQTPDAAVKPFTGGAGVDIVPGISDLNPGIKGKPFAQGVPFGNYQVYFEDPGFDANGLGIIIFGFFANIFFMGSVFLSKLFTLFMNFSINSSLIADLGAGAFKYVASFGSKFLTTMFGIMMPLAYGSWTIYKGFVQKKYTVAVVGLLGAIMVYSVGNLMLTKGDVVLKGMTTTSSKLGQSFMQLTSGSGGTVDPLVTVNDNIWLSQIYVPWSLMQFGQTGLPADISKSRNGDGSLNLQIPMNDWEKTDMNQWWDNEDTIIGASMTGNWATTLYSSVEPNSKGKGAIGKTLNDKSNPRVKAGWRASPGASMINSLILIIINLLQSVIMGVLGLVVLASDAIIVVAMLMSFLIFFVALIPAWGARIYRAYLSIIISAFIVKIIYGAIIGVYTSTVTATYLSMYGMMGKSQFAIFFAGLVSILINAAFIALGWFFVKKVGISPIASMGSLATNFATGNMDAARAQWGEFTGRFGSSADYGMMRTFQKLTGNDDMNKYVLGIDSEQLIRQEYNKLRQAQSEDDITDKDIAKLDNLIGQSEKLQRKSKDQGDYNTYQNLTRQGREFKAELLKSEMEALEKGPKGEDYFDKLQDIQSRAAELEAKSIGAPSVQRTAQGILGKVLEAQSSADIKRLEDYRGNLNVYDTKANELEKRRNNGDINERTYNRELAELRGIHGNIDKADYESQITEMQKELSDRMENAEDDKTYRILEKSMNQVNGFHKEVIDDELAHLDSAGKIEALRQRLGDDKILRNTNIHEYVKGIYDKERIKLLDKSAAGYNDDPDKEFNFWKGEIHEQLISSDAMRDNALLEHAKGKIENLAVGRLEKMSEGLLEYGTVISNTQLDNLREESMKAMNDYVTSGASKNRINDILAKVDATTLINENAQKPYDIQAQALSKAMSESTSDVMKSFLQTRLLDVESNGMREQLTGVLSQIKDISIQMDANTVPIEDIQRGLESAVKAIDFNKLVPEGFTSNIKMDSLVNAQTINAAISSGNLATITNELVHNLEEGLKNLKAEIPVTDQLNASVVQGKINAVNAVLGDIGSIAGTSSNKSEELQVKEIVDSLNAQLKGDLANFGKILVDRIANQNISTMDAVIKNMKNNISQTLVGAQGQVESELKEKLTYLNQVINQTSPIADPAIATAKKRMEEEMAALEDNNYKF